MTEVTAPPNKVAVSGWIHILQPLAAFTHHRGRMPITWRGAEMAARWQQRFEALRSAANRDALRSIGQGFRRIAVTPSDPTLAALADELDLVEWTFSAGQDGAALSMWGDGKARGDLQAAMARRDADSLAELLGLPSYLHWFWREVWEELGQWDCLWPALWQSFDFPDDATTIEVEGSSTSFDLTHHLGLAWPCLPCHRFDQTDPFADEVTWARSGRTEEQQRWLEEIHRWSWVWKPGDRYTTLHLPVGHLRFPKFGSQTVTTIHSVGQVSVPVMGLVQAPVVEVYQRCPDWIPDENDFRSRLCLDHAHEPILNVATRVLNEEPGAVIDLGCGNGYLLQKLARRHPNCRMAGIEWDSKRHARAGHLLQDTRGVICGDIFADERPWSDRRRYRLAILMLGRLTEVSPARQRWLKQRLKDCCDHVLVYLYSNWKLQWSLAELAPHVGLTLQPGGNQDACLAQIDPDGQTWIGGKALVT